MTDPAAPMRVDELDNADPTFQADPYPRYAFMRREAPVYYRERNGFRMGHCYRYDDVVETLRSPDFETISLPKDLVESVLAQPDSPLYDLARVVSSVMLIKDGEDHRRLRGLANKAFTPRMVEGLRGRITRIVDDLLDAAAEERSMELLTDFAAPLPIIVIAELLGLPAEDHEALRHWSDQMATFIDGNIRDAGLIDAAAAAREMCPYLEQVIEARRQEPRDDLISALVAAQEASDHLTENELLGAIGLILGAGHETTTNLIGNGVRALLLHREQFELLRRSPELIESAVEELLRFDAPVQATSRIAKRDLEIRGIAIPEGAEVGLYLGSANRDPEVFPDPDVLDVTRRGTAHLSFGHGAHFCLGAALARLEAQVAIGALVERFPKLRMRDASVSWRPGLILHGMTALHVDLA